MTGNIHYLDPIMHHLHIEVQPAEFKRVLFVNIIKIDVLDSPEETWRFMNYNYYYLNKCAA
jgi:hypothetical protein